MGQNFSGRLYLFIHRSDCCSLSAHLYSQRIEREVNSGAMWLFPKEITWAGYQLVFENPKIWNGYLNTIVYTGIGTLLNLAVTLPALMRSAGRIWSVVNCSWIYPVYDVLYRRACANVSRSPEFGADQHDGGAHSSCSIGMEHHRCPDVLPDDDSQGTAGSGIYGRLYQPEAVRPHYSAAVRADYCSYGFVLRGQSLEQLLSGSDLSQR